MSETLAAADYAMRHWHAPEPGRIAPGSEAHKRAFCRMLLETHNPYKPAVIQWPRLSPEALARVTSLPIWDIAVQTEGRASIRVQSFAESVTDPLLRQALEPAYEKPRDPEWAWLVTGYSECIDSFFAFGLFEVAKRSGYFPPELVETFEPVMQEEGRHILFFVNWAAWYRRNMAWWRRPWFFLKTLAVWAFLIWERIGIARGLDRKGEMQDANFTATGAQQLGIDITPRQLLEICLAEND